MMSDLLNCPFCGGEPILRKIGNDFTKRSVEIKCKDCRVLRINSAIRNSMDWLVNISTKEWNTRYEKETNTQDACDTIPLDAKTGCGCAANECKYRPDCRSYATTPSSHARDAERYLCSDIKAE